MKEVIVGVIQSSASWNYSSTGTKVKKKEGVRVPPTVQYDSWMDINTVAQSNGTDIREAKWLVLLETYQVPHVFPSAPPHLLHCLSIKY